MSQSEADLRARVAALEAEICLLRARANSASKGDTTCTSPGTESLAPNCSDHSLSNHQIQRYSRQLLLPSFGVQAQERLSTASVLIVGAGGLGCPSSLYLAAAGLGRLSIVDHDKVEISNLHRQISHTEAGTGQHKALSAAAACRATNSSIQVIAYPEGFRPDNALQLVQQHSVVIDASDNSPTRYLLSDACAISKTPLVSGAAIGFDAQITVYCHGSQGPCYRCIFPEAPMPRACASCSDAGVLGPVPGVIGVLQALEAIKLITQVGSPLSQTLLLFDAMAGSFRSVKIRPKRTDCVACGEQPSITAATLAAYDYTAFTGMPAHDSGPPTLQLLEARHRVTPEAFAAMLGKAAASASAAAAEPASAVISSQGAGQQADRVAQVRVVDVRPEEQFRMAHLPGSVNVPFRADETSTFPRFVEQVANAFPPQQPQSQGQTVLQDNQHPQLCVVCRRGNDSQRAVAVLHEAGFAQAMDIQGGLQAWAALDTSFPSY